MPMIVKNNSDSPYVPTNTYNASGTQLPGKTVPIGGVFKVDHVKTGNNGETWYVQEVRDDITKELTGYICVQAEGFEIYKSEEQVDDAEEAKSEQKDNSQESTLGNASAKFAGVLDMYSQLTELNGIMGMPYGYLENTDRPISAGGNSKTEEGWMFSDRIITKMPLLVLTPGKPDFLPLFTADQKKSMEGFLADIVAGSVQNADTILNEITNNDSTARYYTFKFDSEEYYNYLNSVLRLTSRYLGISEINFHGVPLGRYNWADWANDQLTEHIAGINHLAYYIESETQISERFSNDTGDSTLSATFNRTSAIGKELSFMLGAGAGVMFDELTMGGPEREDGSAEKIYDAMSGMFDKYMKPDNIISRLTEGLTVTGTGGSLIFPEIWKDSHYSKDYDVTLKLSAPDGDNLSIFLNIFVPMYSLLCLTLPRQTTTNGYYTPFLVRGFYKGFFNIDMGIITDLSIEKGEEGGWNVNGLPTEMTIKFTLKDLYQTLGMTKGYNPVEFLRNTQYMDFIANMAGINLTKPELDRTIDYYKWWAIASFSDAIDLSRIFDRLNQGLQNIFYGSKLYNNYIRIK